MATSFKALYHWLVPSWLSSGPGEGILYAIAETLDQADARWREALTARFPTKCENDEMLALTGLERGIPRGLAEEYRHYAKRLCAWRYPRGHRVRGGAPGLIEQVSEYFGGRHVESYDANGNHYVRHEDGSITVEHDTGWTWDTRPVEQWARFWLLVDVGPYYDRMTLTLGMSDDLRALLYGPHPWRPAGTQPEWAVFGPFASANFIFDELYGDWLYLDGDTHKASRNPNLRYVSLCPTWNNTFAGDPTDLATYEPLIPDPDPIYEDGDPNMWEDPAMLTDYWPFTESWGTPGDPTDWQTTLTLLDDGDIV